MPHSADTMPHLCDIRYPIRSKAQSSQRVGFAFEPPLRQLAYNSLGIFTHNLLVPLITVCSVWSLDDGDDDDDDDDDGDVGGGGGGCGGGGGGGDDDDDDGDDDDDDDDYDDDDEEEEEEEE